MVNQTKEYNFIFFSICAIFATLLRWQIDQIFLVNTIGSFLLGFIKTLSISRRYKFTLGFAFCGSLTTFSGWMFGLFELLSNGFYLQFIINIVSIVLISFLALYLGNLLAKVVNQLI